MYLCMYIHTYVCVCGAEERTVLAVAQQLQLHLDSFPEFTREECNVYFYLYTHTHTQSNIRIHMYAYVNYSIKSKRLPFAYFN